MSYMTVAESAFALSAHADILPSLRVRAVPSATDFFVKYRFVSFNL